MSNQVAAFPERVLFDFLFTLLQSKEEFTLTYSLKDKGFSLVMLTGKIVARNITPIKGDVRFVVETSSKDDKGKDVVTQYTAFVTPVQIQTLNSLGEKIPAVGSSVGFEPSDVAGKNGELFCQINL